MNKKQNLLLWYLTIALVVLLTFGFNNGDLDKLNNTTFSIMLLVVIGSCALITTRGVNGLDFLTIKLQIFPIIYILIYYIPISIFIEFKVNDLMYQPLSATVTNSFTPKASLKGDRFSFDKSNLNNWIINEANVSIFIKSEDKPDELSEKVHLNCYRYRSVDTCYGETMFDYKDVKWSWTLDKTYGKLSGSFPNLYYLSALIGLIIYIPLGMFIVFLTKARETIRDVNVDKAIFIKRFAYYTIVYLAGILLWPLFLNSWFSNNTNDKRTLLDDFSDAVNSGSTNSSKLNLNSSVDLAFELLLAESINKDDVRAQASELIKTSINYSTKDLALVVALYFFMKPEMKDTLFEAQLMARLTLQEWIQEKSVNLIIAKTFEDKLYKLFK